MIETLNCEGDNNYKLPHLKKDQLFRQRVLPQKLSFDKYLYQSIVDKFMTPEIPQAAPVQIAPPPPPPPADIVEPEQQFFLDLPSDVEGESEEEYEGLYREGGRQIVI